MVLNSGCLLALHAELLKLIELHRQGFRLWRRTGVFCSWGKFMVKWVLARWYHHGQNMYREEKAAHILIVEDILLKYISVSFNLRLDSINGLYNKKTVNFSAIHLLYNIVSSLCYTVQVSNIKLFPQQFQEQGINTTKSMKRASDSGPHSDRPCLLIPRLVGRGYQESDWWNQGCWLGLQQPMETLDLVWRLNFCKKSFVDNCA